MDIGTSDWQEKLKESGCSCFHTSAASQHWINLGGQ